MRNSLRIRLTIIFIGLAIGPLLLVGAVLARSSFVDEREQALDLQGQVAQRAAAEIEAFLQDVENDLILLEREMRDLEQPDRAQQLSLLLSAFSSGPYRDVYEEFIMLDDQGQEQLRVSRQEVIPADQLGNRSGAAEFEQPKASGETYFSPVWFDANTGKAFITMALPFSELRSVQLKRVLVANVRFKAVGDLIAGLQVSEGQTIYVVEPEGQVVAHQDSSVGLQDLRFKVPESGEGQTGLMGTDVVLASDRIQLGEQAFIVVAERPAAEALESAFNTVYTIVVTVMVALVIAAGLGFVVVGQIVRPIETLSVMAQAISAGDLSQQANITSRDELGILAGAFNSMAAQLQALVGSLEQQVTDRTARLEIVAALGEHLSAILDVDELLTEVVNQVQERFGYYHAHIYLIDDNRQNLVMAAGFGQAGAEMKARGHSIPLQASTSLVARAARTNEIVWSSNVRETKDWLPNPLLPDTYAEMAVPITLGRGGEVMGVLDVQEDEIAGLNEGDAALLRSLANQVAVAIRNARLFETVETALAEARLVQERYQQEAWQKVGMSKQSAVYQRQRPGAPSLNEIVVAQLDQEAVQKDRPVVVAINGGKVEQPRQTVREQESSDDAAPEDSEIKEKAMVSTQSSTPNLQNALVAPIRLQNHTIGTIQLHEIERAHEWTSLELALVQAVADQVAQVAENLRLFDETRKNASREATIREITDKLRTAPNLEQLVVIATEELGQHLSATHGNLKLGVKTEANSNKPFTQYPAKLKGE